MLGKSLALGLASAAVATAQLSSSSLESFVDVLDLGDYSFDPLEKAYWTDLPHHRRTPFSVSPDGTKAYLAFLDESETDVHVIGVDPTTFKATGTTVTVTGGKEAGGLVAQDDGFALLTNVAVTGDDAPPSGTPVPVIVRYTDGEETWRTFVAGPGVHESDGLAAAPDMNGDLVYSEAAGMYGAYFVITDYTGDASGHYGDSIQYVTTNGTLKTISGASSSWGCSHNTGIAFEAADEAPFASICAEDQGDIWLNTKTQGMSNDGVKISNENTTNGASGEPMGGMSGSYSALARFGSTSKYIFAWSTRGAIDLTENSWLGDGYTNCKPRTHNRNVAIAVMTDKETLKGDEATSTVGATSGDSQLDRITTGTADHSNVHIATFDDSNALLTWEEIADPTCDTYGVFGCSGTFTGAYYQLVDSDGNTVGDAISSDNIYVAGDIAKIGEKLCFPYVNMTWDLSQAVDYMTYSMASKISFGCVSLSGSSNTTTSASTSSAVASSTASASSVAASTVKNNVATSAVATSASSVVAAVSASSAASTTSSVALSDVPAVFAASASVAASSTPATTYGTIASSTKKCTKKITLSSARSTSPATSYAGSSASLASSSSVFSSAAVYSAVSSAAYTSAPASSAALEATSAQLSSAAAAAQATSATSAVAAVSTAAASSDSEDCSIVYESVTVTITPVVVTAYATVYHTITSCASDVTNCPASTVASVVPTVSVLYTSAATSAVAANTAVASSAAGAIGTSSPSAVAAVATSATSAVAAVNTAGASSTPVTAAAQITSAATLASGSAATSASVRIVTVYTTEIESIVSCPSYVSQCTGGSMTTTVAVETTAVVYAAASATSAAASAAVTSAPVLASSEGSCDIQYSYVTETVTVTV